MHLKLKFETLSLKNQYYFNSKDDEDQFSPYNTNTLSSEEVMRIDKMIIWGKMLWSFFQILSTSSLW